MQVEVPPWVTHWLSAAEWRRRQRERDRRLPGLTLYAYGPYGRDPPADVQPIFRIGSFPEPRDGVLGPRFGTGAGAGPGANTPGGWVPLQYPLDPFLAHNPNDLSHLPINVHDARPQRVDVQWVAGAPPASEVPVRPAGDEGALSGRAALRAWVFGSALIVLVIVLVRAIDKCLTVNILKSRRRAQEWPTPNVRATNRQGDISTVMIPNSESDELRPAEYNDALSVDLPPPYSECTTTAGSANIAPGVNGHKLPDYEDPPPAYSDTYVEFSNMNGVPSVLIYSRRRTPLVNRRDIDAAGSDSTDRVMTDQCVPTNTEITNEEVSRDIISEARQENASNTSHSESLIATNATLCRTDLDIENNTTGGDLVASSSQYRMDADVDTKTVKDGEIIV